MELVSVNIKDDGRKLEITKRFRSNAIYLGMPPTPVPDRVIREDYEVQDGKLVLVGQKEGKVLPASVLKERISFD